MLYYIVFHTEINSKFTYPKRTSNDVFRKNRKTKEKTPKFTVLAPCPLLKLKSHPQLKLRLSLSFFLSLTSV